MRSTTRESRTPSWQHQLGAMDGQALSDTLNHEGWASINSLLTVEECSALIELYSKETLFRKRVVMSRHGFGRGEYQYFGYPLPSPIAELRTSLYRQLVPVANQWNRAMGSDIQFPSEHEAFLASCNEAGQSLATPLMLKYETGDYNCLHQDLYGDHVFPLQAAVMLSTPQRDFSGGEFVLTEQRPRMQSRAAVVPLQAGDACVFAVHQRPLRGARGHYRVNMRHGVSRVTSGERYVLGIIFHDATK